MRCLKRPRLSCRKNMENIGIYGDLYDAKKETITSPLSLLFLYFKEPMNYMFLVAQ